jgi:hypothetical protein
MSANTTVQVFNPFQNRLVAADADQARILRQVAKTMQFYIAAAEERARLAQREWSRKSKTSLLGEIELFDTTVAGVASWCRSSRPLPRAGQAVKQMASFDAAKISRQLKAYPKLQQYVHALERLRDLVVDYIEARRAA